MDQWWYETVEGINFAQKTYTTNKLNMTLSQSLFFNIGKLLSVDVSCQGPWALTMLISKGLEQILEGASLHTMQILQFWGVRWPLR